MNNFPANTVRIEKTDRFTSFRIYINGMDISNSVVDFTISAGVHDVPRLTLELTNIRLDVAEPQEKDNTE